MGVGVVDVLRMPLFGLAYGLLLFTLWHNRTYPGLALAFVGIALNGLVILVNGGRMPVWMDAYACAGLTGPTELASSTSRCTSVNAEFFLRLGPLADIIPLPIPPFQNVASIGDLFLSAGLGFFLFATLLRSPAEAQRGARRGARGPPPRRQRDRPPARTRHRDPAGAAARSPRAPASARPSRRRPRSSGRSSSARRGTGQARPPPLRPPRPTARSSRTTASMPSAAPSPRPPSPGSAATRTSASRSTARSRRCGSAS